MAVITGKKMCGKKLRVTAAIAIRFTVNRQLHYAPVDCSRSKLAILILHFLPPIFLPA
jgi:hypothetical protein